ELWLVLTLSKPALWHMFNHMIDYLSLFSFQRSVPVSTAFFQSVSSTGDLIILSSSAHYVKHFLKLFS
ncbi:hypothetical protein, partial [Veillonella sp.]|uniref:hypothetical protein n=2 Tax=Veillonella sp. TaxID=1926307 RepID=UPI0025EA30EC